MRILISNDDGVAAPGLAALVKELCRHHEVAVAAPTEEQSGMSHAFTVHKRIYVTRYEPLETKCSGVVAYSIGGTPTDCVKLYLEGLAEETPELIISGINHGANLGTDVVYSGTIGAALEGWLHKIPAIAVSLDKKSEISYDEVAAILSERLPKFFADEELPFFLNINFPVRFSTPEPDFVYAVLGGRDYKNAFSRHEEDGKVYYVVGGEAYDTDDHALTDIYAVKHGRISVTPLISDITDYYHLSGRI